MWFVPKSSNKLQAEIGSVGSGKQAIGYMLMLRAGFSIAQNPYDEAFRLKNREASSLSRGKYQFGRIAFFFPS